MLQGADDTQTALARAAGSSCDATRRSCITATTVWITETAECVAHSEV